MAMLLGIIIIIIIIIHYYYYYNDQQRHPVIAYRAVIPHPPSPNQPSNWKLLESATSNAMLMYTIRANPGKFWYIDNMAA